METKVTKLAYKIICFMSSLLLTLLAGVFAFMSLSAFFLSIIEKDLVSVIGCVVAGFLAWVTWSVRRDLL
jgi:hypothetical protein